MINRCSAVPNQTATINNKLKFLKEIMKWISVILWALCCPFKSCFCQPLSWFVGAGAGITQLRTDDAIGKPSTNTGQMGIVMTGVDIPLHENLRPMVRATLSGYRALFHTTMDGRGLSESFSIHLNSITPDLSFLYNMVDAKLKLYLGVGVDVNVCWPTHYKFKMINSQTGFVYREGEGFIPLEPCWPSFNVKAGLKLGNWELGATGYIRGIIAWNDIDILNGDIYFIFLGYHFGKK